MSTISIRLAMWLFASIAVIALGTLAYQWAFARGAASRQGEINSLSVKLTLLDAATRTANAEAARRAQESAENARRIEVDAKRRIDEATAAAEAAEAARMAAAGEYDRRLRAALAARTRRSCDPVRDAGVPEAAGPVAPSGPDADVVLLDEAARDLGALARAADAVNDSYRICLAAARAGRPILRNAP